MAPKRRTRVRTGATSHIWLDREECSALEAVLRQRIAQLQLQNHSSTTTEASGWACTLQLHDALPVAGSVIIGRAIGDGECLDMYRSAEVMVLCLRGDDVSRMVSSHQFESYLDAALDAVELDSSSHSTNPIQDSGEAQVKVLEVTILVIKTPTGNSPRCLHEAASIVAMHHYDRLHRQWMAAVATPYTTLCTCCCWDVVNSLDEAAERILHLSGYVGRQKHAKQRTDGHNRRKQRKCEVSDFFGLYRDMMHEVDGMSERRATSLASGDETQTFHDLLNLCSAAAASPTSTRQTVREKIARSAGFGETHDTGIALADRIVSTLTQPFIPEQQDGRLRSTLATILTTFKAFFEADADRACSKSRIDLLESMWQRRSSRNSTLVAEDGPYDSQSDVDDDDGE